MIKNIVFDFGGVVVNWDPHLFYDKYFGDRAKADWFLTEICPYEWNAQHDAGKPIAEGVAERIVLYPEWEKEIRMYYDNFLSMIGGEVPGVLELIRELKVKGYHVFGLTNWSAETLPLVRPIFPVFDEFEGIVVSGAEKVVKPDPAIFKILLERYKLNVSESVFIDDNAVNVAASSDLGFTGILFKDTASLRKSLETI